MTTPIIIAMCVIITLCIVFPIAWLLAIAYRKKSYEAKIGNAEEKSREIIDEALKTAETTKREAVLEAKEESLKTKNELEKRVKNAELRFNVMKNVFFQKKKCWTRSQNSLKRKKMH